MTLDRVTSREIVVTQEMMAAVLGVRRESVTEVAGGLQRAGVISYRRGHISVLHREGLNSRVCECYAAVRRQMPRPCRNRDSRQHHLLQLTERCGPTMCGSVPTQGVRVASNNDEEFANGRLSNRSTGRMNKDRIEGNVRQAVGSVKEVAGEAGKYPT